MSKQRKLPITEELDFSYLLTMMRSLFNEPMYEWLPELFCLIDFENLLNLVKYCGGETIKIPTMDQMNCAIQSLQWAYDVYIKQSHSEGDIPEELKHNVMAIKESLYASNS